MIALLAGDRIVNEGPAAMAGYPHITVPAGMVYGLPVGPHQTAATTGGQRP